MGRAPQTALGAQQRSVWGGGLRGQRGWPWRGAGAPRTSSSLYTGSNRARAGLCRVSAQGLASRGSATHWGPRSALADSEEQMDAGLPGPLPESGVERVGRLGLGQ